MTNDLEITSWNSSEKFFQDTDSIVSVFLNIPRGELTNFVLELDIQSTEAPIELLVKESKFKIGQSSYKPKTIEDNCKTIDVTPQNRTISSCELKFHFSTILEKNFEI